MKNSYRLAASVTRRFVALGGRIMSGPDGQLFDWIDAGALADPEALAAARLYVAFRDAIPSAVKAFIKSRGVLTPNGCHVVEA